ncbi:hypothetical protein [Micrococcus luteus]|uniref:hypothetical protein n=1 Tax=Micrococcus luteus TaxID=1270 RepID=UPI00369AB768
MAFALAELHPALGEGLHPLPNILLGILTLALLVMLIGEIAQFKKIRAGEGRLTAPIFFGAVIESLSAFGMIAMVLVYADSIDVIRLLIQGGLMLLVLVMALVFRAREPVSRWVFATIAVASLGCYIYSSF